MTSYPEILTVKKLIKMRLFDQDGIFYYKDLLHFFFEWPKYYTYKKSYKSWVSSLKHFLQILQIYPCQIPAVIPEALIVKTRIFLLVMMISSLVLYNGFLTYSFEDKKFI
jgi:hypothetical protein